MHINVHCLSCWCRICRHGSLYWNRHKTRSTKNEMFLQHGRPALTVLLALRSQFFLILSTTHLRVMAIQLWRVGESVTTIASTQELPQADELKPFKPVNIMFRTCTDVRMPKSSRYLKNIVQKGVSTCNYGEKSYFKNLAPRNALLSTTIFPSRFLHLDL